MVWIGPNPNGDLRCPSALYIRFLAMRGEVMSQDASPININCSTISHFIKWVKLGCPSFPPSIASTGLNFEGKSQGFA